MSEEKTKEIINAFLVWFPFEFMMDKEILRHYNR